MQEVYMKTYRRQHGLLVAVCDKDLLGKKIKDDDVEVDISTHFYKGDLVGKAEVFDALKGAFSGNFFGKDAVDIAIEFGIVNKAGVKKMGSIPHAQFIRMEL